MNLNCTVRDMLNERVPLANFDFLRGTLDQACSHAFKTLDAKGIKSGAVHDAILSSKAAAERAALAYREAFEALDDHGALLGVLASQTGEQNYSCGLRAPLSTGIATRFLHAPPNVDGETVGINWTYMDVQSVSPGRVIGVEAGIFKGEQGFVRGSRHYFEGSWFWGSNSKAGIATGFLVEPGQGVFLGEDNGTIRYGVGVTENQSGDGTVCIGRSFSRSGDLNCGWMIFPGGQMAMVTKPRGGGTEGVH